MTTAVPKNLATDWSLYSRLFGHLKPYRFRFIIGLLASIPAASMDGAIAWAIGPFLDYLTKKHDYSMLLFVPLVVIGISALQGICIYISTYCNSYISTAISRDFRDQLFYKLIRMDYDYFRKNDSGTLITRYISDPAALQQAIVNNLQDFIIELFSLIALSFVLFNRNWQLALVAIAIISTIFFPLQIISKKIRRLDNEAMKNNSQLITLFNESIYTAKVVIGFQLVAHQQKRFKKALNEYFVTSMRMAKAGTWLKPSMQMIASLGIGAIILCGTIAVQQETMTIGDLASFLMALILMYKPVKTVTSIIGKVQRILAPAERVFEKLDEQPGIQDAPSAIELENFETIEFENVGFSYNPGQPVLKNISFQVRKGEMIALVGPSGGGKSTMVDLICRFMDPQEGRILFNGVDIRDIRQDSLRSLITFVSQDPLLFGSTIRENIMVGKLNATEAEFMQACREAHVIEFMDRLPLGMDTPIGQYGGLLSGGQKQRIAIARAFIKNAPILILDEATSALDNESEALVQDAMKNVMHGRTSFVIAHRLSTIQGADRILVIDAGQIAETGTHQELLARHGLYHRLYQLQFRHQEGEPRLPSVPSSDNISVQTA